MENFMKLAQGVQSIVVTVAVIVGGIWTVYTFSVLGTAEKAKLELFQQPVVDVNISAQQASTNDKKLYLYGEAVITNKGSRNTVIAKETTITISKFSFNESGSGEWHKVSDFSYGQWMVLRSGASYHFPFATTVLEKGIYSIDFRSPVEDKQALEAVKEREPPQDGPFFWHGSTFLIVK